MTLTLEELLVYTDEERLKWERWVAERGDEALSIEMAGNSLYPTVGKMIQHLFGPQLWWMEWILGRPATEWWKEPESEAFRLGRAASDATREVLQTLRPEDWTEVRDFQARGREFRLTARKAVANALIHAIRHWAQVTAAVRQSGLEPPGEHDMLFSKALE